MDKGCRKEMDETIHHYFKDRESESLRVLDVGSYDINGSLRDVLPDAWDYTGLDIVEGPNVDCVMDARAPLPVEDASLDLVVSVSCFQYVENPFKLAGMLYAALKPGGVLIVCAASDERTGLISLPLNLCPHYDQDYDCWRFKRYGMIAMLEESGFDVDKAYYKGSNCWGVGIK